MIARFRLIQFREDPLRGEGRNVAVIAWTGGRAHLRALGVNPFGSVNPTRFERLLPEAARSSSWVYAEWVERWADAVQRLEGNPEALLVDLDQMEAASAGYFVAMEEGEIEIDQPQPAEPRSPDFSDIGLTAARRAADLLYERLVAGGTAGGFPIPFLEAVESALSISEIRALRGFQLEESFAIGKDAEPETVLFFPYLVEGQTRTAFKVVCFNGPLWERVVAAVNDAVLTFDMAVESGWAERDRCIALVDTPGPSHQLLAARLARSSVLIDVTAPQAASRIRQLMANER